MIEKTPICLTYSLLPMLCYVCIPKKLAIPHRKLLAFSMSPWGANFKYVPAYCYWLQHYSWMNVFLTDASSVVQTSKGGGATGNRKSIRNCRPYTWRHSVRLLVALLFSAFSAGCTKQYFNGQMVMQNLVDSLCMWPDFRTWWTGFRTNRK